MLLSQDELIGVAEKSVLRVPDLLDWLANPKTLNWDRLNINVIIIIINITITIYHHYLIFQQVEHHHHQNHRLLISLAKKQSFHLSDFATTAVFDIIVSGVAAN